MKKILIIGASGFVGSYLYDHLSSNNNYEVLGTCNNNKKKYLKYLNYTDNKIFSDFLQSYNPEIIIWSAGEKDLNKTEKDELFEIRQNIEPIKIINKFISKIKNQNLYLIFISSDYVFSGRKGNYLPSDIPEPNTKYGESKYLSEIEIIRSVKNHCILRVGGLLGKGGSFFDWITSEISQENKIELNDEFFSPTPIFTICEAIGRCIDRKLIGIFHLSGNERISKIQLGNKIKNCYSNNRSILTKKRSVGNSHLKDRSLIISKEFEKLYDLKAFVKSIKNDKIL